MEKELFVKKATLRTKMKEAIMRKV